MKKKALKYIPVPKTDTKKIREIAMEGKGKRGVIATQKKKVDSEETLILNVYQVSGRNKRDISLLFRVFCQKDDYITLEVECGKWRTGSLLNLVCREAGWAEYWWSYDQLEFLSDADVKRAEIAFRKWNKTHTDCGKRPVFDLLHSYQNHIKSLRLERRHKKETDAIDKDMEMFGPVPDDYQTFIEENVFRDENYIFYSTNDKRAFCTSCGKTFILENKHLRHETIGVWNDRDLVKHNRIVCCPYCSKFLKAKSEGMSRKSLVSVKWSVLVQPHGDEVFTRYFRHIKDFRKDYHNPDITTAELYRTVHRKEKATDYMWARFKNSGNIRWCYYKESGPYWQIPSEFVAPRHVTLYNTNMQVAVDGTCMKYSAPDIFFEKVANDERYFRSPWIVDNYFNSYRKYPFVEQMMKVGFYKMTREFLDEPSKMDMNKGQNSILGTLGINKIQYNYLRKIGDPSLRDLEILKYKPDLKFEEFQDLRYLQDDGYSKSYTKYIDLMRFTTLHKMRRYINDQHISNSKDYFDYTDWMEEMGYDMKNEFNLFPRNFIKAHDEASKQYMRFKDKQAREDTKRFNRMLRKMKRDNTYAEAMNIDIGGLFIRLPNRLDELKDEGEALHHCVGTYMEKVRKGETMIFFIRKKSEPDKPYYTLEWHGSVVQCRGLYNCDMTQEVKEFVKIFQENMEKFESEPQRHRKAG